MHSGKRHSAVPRVVNKTSIFSEDDIVAIKERNIACRLVNANGDTI